ncbi:MAG: fructose-bisphosphate aldolase, class [Candidatus Parcubacteria bacterium]|jgi:fructose-bisphosphate aldolase class I|nr:fructose-bisphosphate aldolase, class [Candidatus Parcubacteria bacterium]
MLDLSDIAQRLVAPGKGILAADESDESADKRLASYGIGKGEEMHRKFRELFLDTPEIEDYLSGVILYKETLYQKDDQGIRFEEGLRARGILPGIKVDEGLEPFPESPKESITNGLLGLSDRLLIYKMKHDTGFTKWRAAITIEGDSLPTQQAIHENAKRLAAYAQCVQHAGMVPILEPEVLLEGKHSRVRSREVLTNVLETLVAALEDRAVDMSAVIVKTAMAISGNKSGRMDAPEEVAQDTVAALMEAVPAQVPGIVFLSGGQTPDQATRNLAAITREARAKHAPWPLTFSYSRALQDEALAIWKGKDENVPAAREAFLARLKQVAEAIA